MQRPGLFLGLVMLAATAHGQQTAAPQASTPPGDGPGRFQAVYPAQYDPMSVDRIAAVLARVHGYLDSIVAMTELLSVLPEDHPGRDAVLAQFRAHAAGLAAHQGGAGLWHLLLDRTDSYGETSATAMFVYSIARGINRGWLDPLAYGPMVSLGWNAVAKQVNGKGQVENACVGTGMGFDPAFYYHRPVSVYAAHGYGPALPAGAEMIALRKGRGADANINDGSVQFAPSPSRF